MVRVVVIDTGLDYCNHKFENSFENGVSLKSIEGGIVTTPDAQDDVGHGTAVSNIILTECKNVKIIPVKVIGVDYYTEECVLIDALKFVLNHCDCDIINMSLGLNVCEHRKELNELINKLHDKGVIVISAFNNDGSMSFPAMLKNVIGVDVSAESKTIDDFEFVENSEVNLLAMGSNQRVLWLNNEYKMVCGSSFATAHVSAIVANLINSGIKPNQVLTTLKKSAKKIIQGREIKELKLSFDIHRAIALPYNKEIHSVVRFEEALAFELVGIYDVRESGNVGKEIIADSKKKYTVGNLLRIDWESDFDTLIIGHINVLQKLLHFDLRKYLFLKSKLYGKSIYSFDYIATDKNEYGVTVFSPYVNETMLPQNTFGKLYHIDKPVLGVFGTGSKQGKFTLQMMLKKRFENDGYEVGYLGTEPSSLLFGAQEVYPMGYENSVTIKGFDSVLLLNKYMYNISHSADIILVGSQANTVPPHTGNEFYYTNKQIEFLMGTQPDAVILCFNAHDDLKYISRTILTIENLIECDVIGAVLFPLKLKSGWAGANGIMEKITEADIICYKEYLLAKHSIKTYFLDDLESINELYQDCINYFAE